MPLSRISSKPAPKGGMHTVYDSPDYTPYVGSGLPELKQKSVLGTQPRDTVVFVQNYELSTSDTTKTFPTNSATNGQETISSPFRSSPKKQADPPAVIFSSGFPAHSNLERHSASTPRYQHAQHFDVHLHPGTAPLSARYSGAPLTRRNSRAVILRRRSKVQGSSAAAEANGGSVTPTVSTRRASQRIIH